MQADGFRRSAHVAVERRAVGIVGDGEVHAHGGQKVGEQVRGDLVAAHGVIDRRNDGLVAMLAAGEKAVRQLLQPLGARDGIQLGIELVEDVVGVPGEGVQRMDRRALVGSQQPGGQEVGASVLGGDLPAAAICGAQVRIVDSGGVHFGVDHGDRAVISTVVVDRSATPVMRSAASRPEISVVGTPTPGTVDDPASTTFSMPRTRFAGRNGPV